MRKSLKKYPKRGEIYIANLDPGFSREIHKKRPVLIVSSDITNQTTYHVVIVPTSSIVPTVLSEDMVMVGKLRGLDKESVLLPLFIRSIDKDRLIKKISKISKQKLLEVEDALELVLGLMPIDL